MGKKAVPSKSKGKNSKSKDKAKSKSKAKPKVEEAKEVKVAANPASIKLWCKYCRRFPCEFDCQAQVNKPHGQTKCPHCHNWLAKTERRCLNCIAAREGMINAERLEIWADQDADAAAEKQARVAAKAAERAVNVAKRKADREAREAKRKTQPEDTVDAKSEEEKSSSEESSAASRSASPKRSPKAPGPSPPSPGWFDYLLAVQEAAGPPVVVGVDDASPPQLNLLAVE